MAENNDFTRKKMTQTDYRGGTKARDKSGAYLDADIEPVSIDKEKKMPFKTFIKEKIYSFLLKIIDEETAKKVLDDGILKKIYSKLGL
ncbi:hypothetical protein OAJ27_00310 [bacterium]|nr:hypothetical protein [bacterium]